MEYEPSSFLKWLVTSLLVGHLTGVAPLLKDLCTQNPSTSAQYIEFLADRDIDVMTTFGWSKRTRVGGWGGGWIDLLLKCAQRICKHVSVPFVSLSLALSRLITLSEMCPAGYIWNAGHRGIPLLRWLYAKKYLSFKLTVPRSSQGRGGVFLSVMSSGPLQPTDATRSTWRKQKVDH